MSWGRFGPSASPGQDPYLAPSTASFVQWLAFPSFSWLLAGSSLPFRSLAQSRRFYAALYTN
eukprot:13663677-Heterocapsa_arctica.AAC.1